MRAVPIVHVGPFRQVGFALFGGGAGAGTGPFPERGLDEPFGLSVGFGRIGLGADVFEAEGLAGCGEGLGLIARAIIGHHAGHRDTKTLIIGHSGLQGGDGADRLFIGEDAGDRDAGSIVDADVDLFPTDPARIALTGAATGDPVSNPFKTAKFLDVEVDQPARLLVVIADDRFRGDQVAQSRQSVSTIRRGAEPG